MLPEFPLDRLFSCKRHRKFVKKWNALTRRFTRLAQQRDGLDEASRHIYDKRARKQIDIERQTLLIMISQLNRSVTEHLAFMACSVLVREPTSDQAQRQPIPRKDDSLAPVQIRGATDETSSL